jgi:hypothetical protein
VGSGPRGSRLGVPADNWPEARIQPPRAKRCADAAWGSCSIFGFLHNAQVVCRGEDTTFCQGDSLGIRRQNRHSPSAILAAAAPRSAAAKPSGERTSAVASTPHYLLQ